MTIYADTNFLTRLYLEMPESAQAERIFCAEHAVFPITWLTRLEVINAFACKLAKLAGLKVIK